MQFCKLNFGGIKMANKNKKEPAEFKVSKDRVRFSNASGDFKTKSFFIHRCSNSRSFKGITKSTLHIGKQIQTLG